MPGWIVLHRHRTKRVVLVQIALIETIEPLNGTGSLVTLSGSALEACESYAEIQTLIQAAYAEVQALIQAAVGEAPDGKA